MWIARWLIPSWRGAYSAALLPRRLQTEHLELLGPLARQIGKTREADAAGQAVVGYGLDQARGEKSQRDLHTSRADGALLPLCKSGDIEKPSPHELVEPRPGLGE